MPSVSEVRPKIWDESSILDLYDDGVFSAIWGNREQSDQRELGVRWNGVNGYVGYPNQGGNPLWFSQPEFLQRSILLTLLEKVNVEIPSPQSETFIKNIRTALIECQSGF